MTNESEATEEDVQETIAGVVTNIINASVEQARKEGYEGEEYAHRAAQLAVRGVAVAFRDSFGMYIDVIEPPKRVSRRGE